MKGAFRVLSGDRLPYALYRADQVRAFDRITISEYGIAGAELMERAGTAAFARIRALWPDARHLTVLCGPGNNGGDGFVVARRAHEAGLSVRVVQVGDAGRLRGDALLHAEAYRATGCPWEMEARLPADTQLLVDALLGTGLDRPVTGAWEGAIRELNAHPAPVFSLDIPSGLNADTGARMGIAVEADATLSFIALKQGMFTAEGPACCGQVLFDALDVPARIYARERPAVRRLDWQKLGPLLPPRSRSAHKGQFGHVLVVGGNRGFGGAALLAAQAAARCGAGLVSLATRPEHVSAFIAACPELMVRGVDSAEDLEPLLERATVVAVGPGLGQGAWARELWDRVLASDLPQVLDADALNLLCARPRTRDDWVLTPHPGEAARLLGASVAQVQQDRFAALQGLQQRYGGVIVLKGAGTLVGEGNGRAPGVCSQGNPGMASGGMGDLLTGMIAAFIAQGQGPGDAAETAVCLHAAAADRAAVNGERGLLASDVLGGIRPLLGSPDGATPGLDA
ncbi:MAG: NAD(P)H-hydrate dehydratase [Pseudomonadota bacterium]